MKRLRKSILKQLHRKDSEQKQHQAIKHSAILTQNIKTIVCNHFSIECEKIGIRDTLIGFMDSLRDYVAESGTDIYQDERDSSEFVDIYLPCRR